MSTIVTRAGKGSPLTHNEVDANFNNLNNDKYQSGDSPSFAGTTLSSGNLTFSGTGQRITGDMSNATLSNRLMFQTSTTNGATTLSVLPNGTSTTGIYLAWNNSDLTNASYNGLFCLSTEARFQADRTGTGTYLPMTFLTSGSERMRLTTDGNLGLGTTSPGARLEVSSASNQSALFKTSATGSYGAVQIFNTNTNGEASIGFRDNSDSDATSWVVGKSVGATDALGFYYGSTRMVIDTSGNVGIGTASPASKLTVGGNPPSSGVLAGVSAADGISLALSDNTNNSLYVKHVAGGAATFGTDSGGQLAFATNGFTERMRLDASGNLLVGTSGQIARLGVVNPTGGYGLAIQGQATDGQSILSSMDRSGTVYTGNITFPEDGSILFGRLNTGSQTTRMTIDSSGNVGIGGTAAAYEKISVSGTYPTSSNVSQGFVSKATIPSGATSSFVGYYSVPSTQAAAFTCTSLYHFLAGFGTKGASSAITSQYGFLAGSDLTGATNNYGFYSDIASGSNRWNFYAAGTAQNYFAGNVGIGRSPSYRLDVEQTADAPTARIFSNQAGFLSSNQAVLFIDVDNGTASSTSSFSIIADYNGTEQFKVRNDGTIYAQNTTVQSISDNRVKENVRTATEGLSVIDALRPVRFDFKNGFGNNRKNQLGFVAQEVEAVFPDAVDVMGDKDENGDPYKSVGPAALIPVLVKAIQELSARLAALEAK